MGELLDAAPTDALVTFLFTVRRARAAIEAHIGAD